MASFQQLWSNHPVNWTPADLQPCKQKNGESAFANQCAIRLGLALEGAGVNTNTVPGARCWHGHGRSHILRVSNLIPWIESRSSTIGCQKKAVHTNQCHLQRFHQEKGDRVLSKFLGNQ